MATHKHGYFYNSKWNGNTGPGSPHNGSLLANSWNHICFQYWNQHQTMTLTINGGEQKYSNMKLNQFPYRPSTEDLHKNGKNFPPNYLHKSWMDYLYWDVELEA